MPSHYSGPARPRPFGGASLLLLLALASTATSQSVFGAPDSHMAGNPDQLQRVLLSPLEPGDPVRSGGWRMNKLQVGPARGVTPRTGRTALLLRGDAEIAGGKGDFTLRESPPGDTRWLGLWVHLGEDANVGQLGLQVQDAEDETLMMLVDADWQGWRWIEFMSTGEHVKQAHPQADKNGRIDQPLKSVNGVWFARTPGATGIAVDGLMALVDPADPKGRPGVTFSLSVPDISPPGQPLPASVLAVNHTAHPVAVELAYSLQRDSSLHSTPLPDPVEGSNQATGMNSWSVADGATIESGALTDGLIWTDAGTDYKADHFSEAFQYVELDRVRRIRKMSWLSGDANHTWWVDVAASLDGSEFTAVEGLQMVDQHKKWGWSDFPISSPFEARVLRFRYHIGEAAQKVPNLRFPSELALYDGVADETIALPRVGKVLEEGRLTATVPARSFRLVDLPVKTTLEAGAVLVGLDASRPGGRVLSIRHAFAAPKADASLVSESSRFGLNTAHAPLAPRLHELGIGWVRFENMKWPFVSPAPGNYDFDGSVAPWRVDTDTIFETYRGNGLNVLSYMFLTPPWASSAPADTSFDRSLTFPPKDPARFGEFCFQTAARYGNTRHPAEVLFSSDKKSGLGLVHYYEMWNEPGLNPSPTATWGGWSAPLDEYYAMMRHGAEAIKRADPGATVTSAGYAGIQVDTVDRLRTYTYPDGKHPLEFVELLNVHYYSGRNPPETATEDGNARVRGGTTFLQDLAALTAWRDEHAKGMPIWMTETGYDSSGPFGTTETVQAARLPRVVMLCLAGGIDKVFVYRESGSTPSMHASSGLLRDDFTEKPSWFTFATLVRQFAGVSGAAERLPHPDPKVWLLKWNNGGEPLVTAWTVEGTAPLGLDLGDCHITDAFGARLTPGRSADLLLTPFPVYIRDLAGSAGWRRLLEAHAAELQARARRRERAQAARKYLFDFGSTDRLGTHLLEGIKFPFTPVLASDAWNDDRGFGFNKTAMSDENRSWVGSKLDGDGCRMDGEMAFRFRIEPGSYHLAIGFSPFEEPSAVRIEGAGKPLSLPVTKGGAPATTEITVPRPLVLSVSHPGYGDLNWLSLVETE